MSLQRLRARARPWHALMAIVFLVGAGDSLRRTGIDQLGQLFVAFLSGLFVLVVFQLTVGNLWGYAVEYYNSGGNWSDPVFLAPFAVAAAVGGAVGVQTGEVVAGLSVAFSTFVLAAGLLVVAVWVVVGYRQARTQQPN